VRQTAHEGGGVAAVFIDALLWRLTIDKNNDLATPRDRLFMHRTLRVDEMTTAAALTDLSIAEAGRRLRSGELTSAALTEDCLARVAKADTRIQAFICLTQDRARADAARADKELRSGIDKGPMHGIPYGLKDLYSTAGVATTCHSHLLVDNVPEEDCFVEQKLRAGGAVLLGKLATHEFATGGPGFDLPFPPPRNPWNVEHITGGSSSGSGAAVAAGYVRMAMGSDTGGSIRGPAFYCGVVGVKPTYGRVSRRGVYPLSYTLDHCGPLTWTVEDAALALQVISGFDAKDPGSVDTAVPDFAAGLRQGIKGVRIAYARDLMTSGKGVSAEVVDSIDAAVRTLKELGAIVEEIKLPPFDIFNACGRSIMGAEAVAIHETDLRTRPEKFGRGSYTRIMSGIAVSGSDYVQAMRLRRELALVVNEEVLGRHDAIVTASALAPASRFADLGPDATSSGGSQSIVFNVTGNPTLSVPTGFARNGLPVGMQIAGRAFDEATLFRIGAAYEAVARPTPKRPSLDAAA
jgi:aspartyl-tRNA(Asn)/glutamyl-tRNA(Gln) amidotransferase subunit A